jgi:3-octaprenyl-4-hydroxybenzoate carboxy-lyase
MHGLWGMGQMMFTKSIVVMDDDVDVHNTSEVLFRLCANTGLPSLRCSAASPQRAGPPKPWRRRNSIFTKGPSDVRRLEPNTELPKPRRG